MAEVQRHDIAIAQPDDAAAIAHMQRQSWIDTYIQDHDDQTSEAYDANIRSLADAFISPERIALRSKVIEDAKTSTDTLYIASKDEDSNITGMLVGYKKPDVQEIHALYTDSRFRGQGLGRALVQRFIDWSDDSQPIELGVLQENVHAIGFYKKMNFEEIPDSTVPFQGNEDMPEIRMKRQPNKEIQ